VRAVSLLAVALVDSQYIGDVVVTVWNYVWVAVVCTLVLGTVTIFKTVRVL
jgi:dUTPase